MGLFLSASGVVQRDKKAVTDAMRDFVASAGGTFELQEGTTDDQNIGVIKSVANMTTVLYPDGFAEWDAVSQHLSARLNTPVFSFHVHDGDLWMLVVFENGEEVAWFNPIPEYWGDVPQKEKLRWAGDANRIASLVPSVTAQSVERYLCRWTDDVFAAKQKAYDDDEFPIGDEWQLTDFMRRLGFAYPIDETGTPAGTTYYLKIRRRRSSTSTVTNSTTESKQSLQNTINRRRKPWWKFW